MTLTERAVFHLSKWQKTYGFHTAVKHWAESIHDWLGASLFSLLVYNQCLIMNLCNGYATASMGACLLCSNPTSESQADEHHHAHPPPLEHAHPLCLLPHIQILPRPPAEWLVRWSLILVHYELEHLCLWAQHEALLSFWVRSEIWVCLEVIVRWNVGSLESGTIDKTKLEWQKYPVRKFPFYTFTLIYTTTIIIVHSGLQWKYSPIRY